MSIIDSAKAHFESLGVQSIEVPEWKDADGKPSVIYWNPINLYEKNILFKKSDNMSDVSILADILVMKGLDKDGNKIFKVEDKKKEIEEQKKQMMEAIQQQKDRIEQLNISKKKKSEIRGKLRFCKNNPEVINEVETLIQEIENKNNQKNKIDLEIKEIKNDIENIKLSKDEENEVYKRVFEKEADKVEKSLPEQSRNIFRNEVDKFDFNLSLNDNIKKMIESVEKKIETNKNIVEDFTTELK
jgi:preprotein translocase subunit SecD